MPTKQSSPGEAPLFSEATHRFLDYARVELQFGAQTLDKYTYCLRRIQCVLGDRPVTDVREGDIQELKSLMLARGNGICWQVVVLAAFKRLLQFCKEQLRLEVMSPEGVTIPRRPRREVIYLTAEEVDRFVRSIPLETAKRQTHRSGLRFRALVEVLLGSAMRIGEVLSLNRTDIDFERKEARVVGKGNKERIVFFTDRALFWLERYLEIRTDNAPALFVSQDGVSRLNRTDRAAAEREARDRAEAALTAERAARAQAEADALNERELREKTERAAAQRASQEAERIRNYSGPKFGTLVWEGEVRGTDLISIENGRVSSGRLTGELPGVPVLVQPLDSKKVGIASSPGPRNEY